MTSPWNRRKNETERAYAAFTTYRSMGSTRSTAKVAQALSKTKTLMDRWSGQHDWVTRAAAWDAHVDAKQQRAYEETAEAIGRRQAQLGRDLQAKAAEGLKHLTPEHLDGMEVARLAKVGADIERVGAGLPTGRLAVTGPDGGPVPVRVDVDPIAAVVAADPEAREAAKRLLEATDKAAKKGAPA